MDDIDCNLIINIKMKLTQSWCTLLLHIKFIGWGSLKIWFCLP